MNPVSSGPSYAVVAFVLLVLSTAAVTLTWQTWQSGRPVSVPDNPHDHIDCVSYTPSHNGHVLNPAVTRKLVAADLALLAKHVGCVRTYSVSEGLDTVPQVARTLGLKVMLGLWISASPAANDREIARGIALANRYRDVVSSVVVGNEVLLRRELTAAQLQSLIERVRSAVKVPVTYADVWEFWLRNPQLANAADFVTVHILPYWEDHPIDIDRALSHVQNIYGKVQAAFPGKRIFIGETGWPSAGRPRLNAVPGLLNEARFVRDFVAYADRNRVPYNLIEAFDQPWKRAQEGTVGGYWGLYDATGHAKFAFHGAIVGNPLWMLTLLSGAAAALATVAVAWLSRSRRKQARADSLSLPVYAVCGYIAGIVAIMQWQYMHTANRNLLDWIATATWTLSGWVAYFAGVAVVVGQIAGGLTYRIPSLAQLFEQRRDGSQPFAVDILSVARGGVLFGAAYVCLGLTYEGRGRDFPVVAMALPAVTLLMHAVLQRFANRTAHAALARSNGHISEEGLLALVLVLCIPLIAWQETVLNARAMYWCAACALLVAAWWLERRSSGTEAAYPYQRTEQSAQPS